MTETRPRGECSVCGRDVAVAKNGAVYYHTMQDRAWFTGRGVSSTTCQGSGRYPYTILRKAS